MTDGTAGAATAALEAERDRLLAERDDLRERLQVALASADRWRRTALEGWDVAARTGAGGYSGDEAEAMRQTLSWRITRPLRAVRRQQLDATSSR